MKLLICLCAVSFIVIVNSVAGKETAANAAPTVSVPLKYLDAAEAYQRLKEAFPKVAEMVKDIQVGPNTLTLNSGHAQYDELRKKLAEIDVRPAIVHLKAVISEMQKDGTEKEVSRRNVIVLDGRPWSVYEMVGGKKFKLSMTATVTKNAAAEK